MFSSYKKHNNQLYNNLVKLSRNNFFYIDVKLEDKIETRLILIFFHFAVILTASRIETKKKQAQEIFDNIFQNIEYSIRELGYGDVAVNKKMKDLTRLFYDILLSFDKSDSVLSDKNFYFLRKYFSSNEKKDTENMVKLTEYFNKFRNFCFDLDMKNMLNGSFNFVYK